MLENRNFQYIFICYDQQLGAHARTRMATRMALSGEEQIYLRVDGSELI